MESYLWKNIPTYLPVPGMSESTFTENKSQYLLTSSVLLQGMWAKKQFADVTLIQTEKCRYSVGKPSRLIKVS